MWEWLNDAANNLPESPAEAWERLKIAARAVWNNP